MLIVWNQRADSVSVTNDGMSELTYIIVDMKKRARIARYEYDANRGYVISHLFIPTYLLEKFKLTDVGERLMPSFKENAIHFTDVNTMQFNKEIKILKI